MSHAVANVNIKIKLDHFKETGKDPNLLLENTNCKIDDFKNLFKRTSWDDYCQILENLEKYGEKGDIEEIGRKGALDIQYSLVQNLFAAFIPIRLLFWTQAKFIGPFLYKNMKYSFKVKKSGTIVITMEAKGKAPSKMLWIGYKNAYIHFPKLLGGKLPAEVNMIHNDHSATFAITIIEKISLYEKLRTLLKIPLRFDSTIKLLNELQTSELENKRLTKELEKRNRQLETHLKIMSHDMATALTIAQNTLKIAIKKNDTQKLPNALLKVDDIISFTNLTKYILSGKRFKPLNELSIKSAVDYILKSYESKAKHKNISFKTSLSDSSIHGDLHLFSYSVLGNIISNSIKFSNKDSEILISSKEIGDDVQIIIRDQGIGIPKQRLEMLLHKKSVTTKGTIDEYGSGLGLDIVKSIVEEYNGSLTIKSVVDSGTEVIITMPRFTRQRLLDQYQNSSTDHQLTP